MNSRHPGKDSAESQEASNDSCNSDGGIQSEFFAGCWAGKVSLIHKFMR